MFLGIEGSAAQCVSDTHPFAFVLLEFNIFFKDLFIYLFMRIYRVERERGAETQAEGEAGFMQRPDMGLDPEYPGSCPGLKVALNH